MSSLAFPRGGGGGSASSSSSSGGSKTSSMRLSSSDALFGSKRAHLIEDKTGKKGEKASGSKRKLGLENALSGQGSFTQLSTLAVGLGMAKPSVANSKAIKVESISYTKFVPGALAMGYALIVADTHIQVSLPGGVTGTVNANEVSDYYYKQFAQQSYRPRIANLSELVPPHSPLRCYVIGTTETERGRKSLQLSLRGSLVHRGLALKHLHSNFPLSGCIASVEDHGFIVNSGVSGITCFLPSKAVPQALGELKLGQPVECVVDEVNTEARTVTLRAQRKSVQEAITRGPSLGFNALHPGMMFSCKIEKVADNGLIVNFLESMHGIIDIYSLSRPMSVEEMNESYTQKTFVNARIVFIDHASKSCRLSLKPHVVEFRVPAVLPKLGEKIEDISVIYMQKKLCILGSKQLQVGEEDSAMDAELSSKQKKALELQRRREQDESTLGIFLHKSAIQSLDSSAAEKSNSPTAGYSVGASIPVVRVVGYHLVEHLVLGSNTDEVLSGEIIHPSQIEIGQTHNAAITGIKDFGLQLQIGGRINVMCPVLHLSDMGALSNAKNLSKQFKLGQKIPVRIWETNKNAIIVTHKKSLVDASVSAILNYDAAEEGMKSIGVISDVTEDGIRLHFFNRVRAYIPMSILVKQGVMDVSESYRVGMVLRCVILKTFEQLIGKNQKAKTRLIAALDIGSVDGLKKVAKAEMQKLLQSDVDPDDEVVGDASAAGGGGKGDDMEEDVPIVDDGLMNEVDEEGEEEDASENGDDSDIKVVAGTLMKVVNDILHVRLDDGRLGHLHKHHCYDLSSTAEFLFADPSTYPIKNGDRIEQLIVINSTQREGARQANVVHLSMKPMFVTAALSAEGRASLPSNVSEVSIGNEIIGYIHKIESFGVLVKFRESFTALAPRQNLTDKFVSTPVGLFNVGDAARCVVQRVDLNEEKVIISFRSSLVSPSSGDNTFLKAMLREKFQIAIFESASSGKLVPNWRKYPLASVCSATVSSIESYGIILVGDDDSTIMLAKTPDNADASSLPAVGAVISVRVVDLDFENCVLLVSYSENLVPQSKDASSSSEKKSKKSKKSIEADVSTASSSSSGNITDAPSVFSEGGSQIEVKVEVVNKGYLVVSSGKDIAYLMVADFHCPHSDTSAYKVGQTVSAKVVKSADARFEGAKTQVLSREEVMSDEVAFSFPHSHVAILSVTSDRSNGAKKAGKAAGGVGAVKTIDANQAEAYRSKFLESLKLGSIMPFVVTEASLLSLKVTPLHYTSMSNISVSAAIHLSCAYDNTIAKDNLDQDLKSVKHGFDRFGLNNKNPFFGLAPGSTVLCRVLRFTKSDKGEDVSCNINLALISTSRTEDASQHMKHRSLVQWEGQGHVQAGSLYSGIVTGLEGTFCTVSVSPFVSGRLNYLDVSLDAALVKAFKEKCFVGLKVLVAAKTVNISSSTTGSHKNVIWSRCEVENSIKDITEEITKVKNVTFEAEALKVGQTISGQIDFTKSSLNPGVIVSLRGGAHGRACLTELEDPENWRDLTDVVAALSSAQPSKAKNGDSSKQDEDKSSKLSLRLPYGQRHGDIVKCKVLSVKGNQIELSLRPSRVASKSKSSSNKQDELPTEGSVVSAYVTSTSNKGCFVKVSHTVAGMILIKDLSNGFVESPEKEFPSGKLVSGSVVSVDQAERRVKMSLKTASSASNSGNNSETAKKEIKKLSEGDIIAGTVQRVTDFGVFIAIQNTSLIGLSRRSAAIKIKPDTDPDLADFFQVGDAVRAKVLGVSLDTSKISLGLKASFFKEADASDSRYIVENASDSSDEEDEEEDSDGDDDNNDDDDMDVDVEESDADDEYLRKLAKAAKKVKKTRSDDDEEEEDDDEEDAYFKMVGEDNDSDTDEMDRLVKEAALRDSESEDDSDMGESSDGDDDDDNNMIEVDDYDEDNDSEEAEMDRLVKQAALRDSDSEEEDSEESSSDSEEEVKKPAAAKTQKATATTTKAASKIGGGAPSLSLDWDDFQPSAVSKKASSNSMNVEDSGDSSDDSDDDSDSGQKGAAKSKKLKQRQKDAEKRKEEEETRRKESALETGDFLPESSSDFERLVISKPSSSYLWIQYIGFYLKSADLPNARATAERALRTINFREEDEKYNVWVAWVNLEYQFGTSETLESTFKRASVESKGKYLHIHLAELYAQANDVKGAEAMYVRTLKKFKYSKKVWMSYQHFRLRQGDEAGASELLSRSMQSLEKHKHVEVTSKFALFEYDIGNIERGRYLFEELVASFPKRTDIWHVYLDREVKSEQLTHSRQLFERMLTLKLSIKNMKTIFKKYLDFEKKFGSEQNQETVKQKARDYVSNVM